MYSIIPITGPLKRKITTVANQDLEDDAPFYKSDASISGRPIRVD
jgi:hypothetical protein